MIHIKFQEYHRWRSLKVFEKASDKDWITFFELWKKSESFESFRKSFWKASDETSGTIQMHMESMLKTSDYILDRIKILQKLSNKLSGKVRMMLLGKLKMKLLKPLQKLFLRNPKHVQTKSKDFRQSFWEATNKAFWNVSDSAAGTLKIKLVKRFRKLNASSRWSFSKA